MYPVIYGIICVALITALAIYAMYRSKPRRLKLSANLLKLISFSIEVESQDEQAKGELGDPDSKRVGRHRVR